MKKSKIGYILVYSAVFCAASIVAGNRFATKLNAEESSTVWGHYDAVDPGINTPGSNEYWINCDTHMVSLTEPTDGTIEERGQPDPDLIASFESSSDGRYISEYDVTVDNGYVYFGEYPQTLLRDEDIATALDNITANSQGYKVYNGEKYILSTSNVYITFEDGAKLSTSNDYYFKVEPIKWKVVSNDDNVLTLLSDKLLCRSKFHSRDDTSDYITRTARNNYNGVDETTSTEAVLNSNYKYSDIRKWLNEEFIYSIGVDENCILATELDNGLDSSCSDATEKYICDDTIDKIFLPSYQDYFTNYGFTDDASRVCYPTEYAISQAILTAGNTSGSYWMRSCFTNSSMGRIITVTGDTYGDYLTFDNHGVRPAIRIDISDD